MLLLAFPDEASADYLLSRVTIDETMEYQNITCYRVLYEEAEFLVVITGHGKVNIGRALLFAETHFEVDAMVGVTVGAALGNDSTPLFSAVAPESSFQFDVDGTRLGDAAATLPLMKTGLFDTDAALTRSVIAALGETGIDYVKARVASADRFIADCDFRRRLRGYFQAGAVDRYSGAIGQAAFLAAIPYTMIIVICHNAGDDGASQYRDYHQEAQQLAAEAALRFAILTTAKEN